MKKREFFSKGLYLESIRRLMLPGMIFLVILALEAILIPIGYVIDHNAYGYSYISSAPEVMNILFVHPLIVITFFIVTPILTWLAFSFLNKRNSSDFYHSLPHTRLALYTSRVAGVFTWILAITLIPAAISYLTVSLFPQDFIANILSYFQMICGCLSASLFVMGVMVCAMSITGTVFTNITVTVLLMFMPRFIMALMTSSVANQFSLIPEEYVSPLLSPEINIISDIIIAPFVGGSLEGIISISSQIYTAIAGIVYLIVAAVLFGDRQSESADRSAPSRFMQSVYRIALTMCICAPITCALFSNDYDHLSSTEKFFMGTGYLVAVLVYFIYELITTKKWKSLVRVIPGLAIVLLLNFVLFFSLVGITAAERNFAPDAEDIKYVQIVESRPVKWAYMPIADFFESEASKIKINNDKVAEIISVSLKISIDHEKGNRYYDYDSYEYVQQVVKIKTAYNTEYRRIFLTNDDFSKISDALGKSDKYIATWMTLPEAQKDTVSIDLNHAYLAASDDEAYEVFRTLKEEVKTLNFKGWHSFITSNKYDAFIFVNYVTGAQEVSVPVSPELMPKTTDLILKIMSDQSPKDLDTLKNELTNGYVYSVKMFLKNQDGSYREREISLDPIEREKIFDIWEEGNVTTDDNFIVFRYSLSGKHTEGIAFVKLPDDAAEILRNID